MEADCGDYIAKMAKALDGEMVMVMSVGDRNDGQVGFEFDDAPAPTGSCDNAFWFYMDVNVLSSGFKVDKSLIVSEEAADNHLDC